MIMSHLVLSLIFCVIIAVTKLVSVVCGNDKVRVPKTDSITQTGTNSQVSSLAEVEAASGVSAASPDSSLYSSVVDMGGEERPLVEADSHADPAPVREVVEEGAPCRCADPGYSYVGFMRK